MADVSELVDASGLIDPSVFPYRSGALGLEWAEEQARFSRDTGMLVGQSTSGVHVAWGGLREHYQAPEAEDLYRKMDPVRTDGEREQEKFGLAAKYLGDYVEDVGAVRPRLANLEADAEAFRARVINGVWASATDVSLGLVTDNLTTSPGLADPPSLTQGVEGRWVSWSQYRPTCDQNGDLLLSVASVIEQIRDAEQQLARRLRLVDDDSRSLLPTRGSDTAGYAVPRDVFDVGQTGVSTVGLAFGALKARSYAINLSRHKKALNGIGDAALTRRQILADGLGGAAKQLDKFSKTAGPLGGIGKSAATIGKWGGAAGGAFAVVGGVNQAFNPRYDGWRGDVDRVMGGVSAVGGVATVGMFLGAAACTGPVGIGIVVGAGLAVGLWELGNLAYDNREAIAGFFSDPMPYLADGLDTVKRATGDAIEAVDSAGDAIGDAVGTAGDFVGGLFS